MHLSCQFRLVSDEHETELQSRRIGLPLEWGRAFADYREAAANPNFDGEAPRD
jgi:hypothetical protein